MNRIRPAKFVHVVYRTRQLAKMVDWYRKVFDAKIQFQNEAISFLTYDDEHHRFAIADINAFSPNENVGESHSPIGVDHVAYSFRSLRELLENYAQLKEMGILPYWSLHHGVTVSLYYADPDGNQMEFQVDSYPNAEASNEFMRGEGYAENPLGVEFHPDEWLNALRAGVPEQDYLIRTIHQPIAKLKGNLLRACKSWGGC